MARSPAAMARPLAATAVCAADLAAAMAAEGLATQHGVGALESLSSPRGRDGGLPTADLLSFSRSLNWRNSDTARCTGAEAYRGH